MRRAASEGRHVNRTPLGYVRRQTGSEKWLEKDEPTAKLITNAFVLILAGKSVRQVLAELTAKGLRNRNGRPLSVSSLHLILTNPFYLGKIQLRGRIFLGNHEPLVPQAVFRRTQVIMAHRRK